jgi:ATP-dependent Clp protease ATP-binding subunit ClpC
VLFLDELHTLIGAGAAEGAIDASNMLKPALSRGEIQTIGATTLDEYRKYIEKDGALERRFQPVIVRAPSVAESVEIIKGLRHKYEAHHRVKITDQAIDAAVKLADRYITDRQLPDKAIDVIDEASSRTRLMALTPPAELKEIEKELERVRREKDMYLEAQEFEKAASLREKEKILQHREEEMKREWERTKGKGVQQVGEVDIEFIVSRWTGIPLAKLEEKESQKLARMEDALHGRIIGQDDAVKAVARAIRRSRAGLKDAKRPVGSFVFLGPTGVGKTELARALAEYLFGDENALIRVDMSEYMEKFSVSRLLGAPPGYVGYEEGGFLTEKVRRRPYSVVLFDEIEKAHPDVFNMLLQVLDDGRLSDSLGHVVDFKNTILIMTSNLGTSLIGKRTSPGFLAESDEQSYEKMKDRVMDEMKRAFRPEFLNRIDDIIVFHSLSEQHIKSIIRLMTTRINKQLTEKGIELVLTPAAENALVEKGYDPTYGARQLRRTIQKHIEDPLAEAIVRGQLVDSARIEVDVEGGTFVFREAQPLAADAPLELAEH